MVAVLVALQGARRTVAETAGLARAVLEGVAELGAEADRAELLQVVIPPGEAPILIRSGAELLAFVGKAAAAGVTGWDTVDVRALHRRFLEGWAAAQARRAGAGEAVRVTGNGSVAIACEPGPDPLPASSPATRRAASARAAS
jgi:hypothetical protein